MKLAELSKSYKLGKYIEPHRRMKNSKGKRYKGYDCTTYRYLLVAHLQKIIIKSRFENGHISAIDNTLWK